MFSRRDGPLFAAIAEAAIRRLHHLAAQDLSNMAWSCSKLAMVHDPLLAAIASAAIPRMRVFVAQDLANTAWSFAYFLVQNVPLLQSIAEQAKRLICDFNHQNLATTAWALEELGYQDNPLLSAISAAVMTSIDIMDPMSMATLLDRPFQQRCRALLEDRFFQIVDSFHNAMIPSLEFYRDGRYQRLALHCRIGNFGVSGGRYLYSKLGISVPDSMFLRRALDHIPRIGRMIGDRYSYDGIDFVRQRVMTYAEHELVLDSLRAPVRGSGTYENARTVGNRWLEPVQPPFCPHADRSTCSEFRMWSSICEMIECIEPRAVGDSIARKRITGSINALVSGPCCVSCIGAAAQFRLLFPNVIIFLAAGLSEAQM